MIEQALLLFREKLMEHNENYNNNDLNYLVEMARQQFNTTNGFDFCRMHSYDTFLGVQLRNIHQRVGIIKRDYIRRSNPGNLDWDQRVEFLSLAEIHNTEEIVMLGYIEGIASVSYSLHPHLLKLLLSCFFDDGNHLIVSDVVASPKRHSRSYLVPMRDNPEEMTSKSISELHKSALNRLNYGLFNIDKLTEDIRSWFLDSENSIRNTVKCLAAIGGLQKIMIQGLTETNNRGIYSYPLAYRISGANHPRLVDQLPIQNFPKEIKASIYNQIDCVNYDIKSSNINMLEKLFRIARLDSSWFIEYLRDPDERRQRLIEITGGTKKQVKKALQVVTNGAPFYSSPRTALGRTFETLDQGTTFVNSLNDLKRCMAEFKRYISDENQNGVFKSRGVWINAVGMTCRFDGGHTFGQICSFLVMGLEQKFILTLVSKLPDNVKVYTLMHDGFICSAEIPEELIDEVKVECDLPYLKFEQQEGF